MNRSSSKAQHGQPTNSLHQHHVLSIEPFFRIKADVKITGCDNENTVSIGTIQQFTINHGNIYNLNTLSNCWFSNRLVAFCGGSDEGVNCCSKIDRALTSFLRNEDCTKRDEQNRINWMSRHGFKWTGITCQRRKHIHTLSQFSISVFLLQYFIDSFFVYTHIWLSLNGLCCRCLIASAINSYRFLRSVAFLTITSGWEMSAPNTETAHKKCKTEDIYCHRLKWFIAKVKFHAFYFID